MNLTIIAGVVAALLLGTIAVQTKRLDNCKTDHAALVAQVEALGQEAKRQAEKRELEDKLNKEKTDAEHLRTLNDFRATIGRLRNERPAGSFVPPAPPRFQPP